MLAEGNFAAVKEEGVNEQCLLLIVGVISEGGQGADCHCRRLSEIDGGIVGGAPGSKAR